MPVEKILIVDDSRNIREIFTSAFEEYNIITAANGTEALAILKKPNDIDLVVMDVMMPEINGLVLLEEAKKINPSCKVVIMTGYSTKDIAIEALRLHADEYLEKPFDIENVKEIFRRLLGQSRNLKAEIFGAEAEKVDIVQRLVERNYHRPLSLQEISKDVFLSYKYLSRIFKERTGLSFNEYRVKLRITQAKRLLKESGYSVSTIAYKVGYHNPDSFMKMFKRFAGDTPSDYRVKIRKATKPKSKTGAR